MWSGGIISQIGEYNLNSRQTPGPTTRGLDFYRFAGAIVFDLHGQGSTGSQACSARQVRRPQVMGQRPRAVMSLASSVLLVRQAQPHKGPERFRQFRFADGAA